MSTDPTQQEPPADVTYQKEVKIPFADQAIIDWLKSKKDERGLTWRGMVLAGAEIVATDGFEKTIAVDSMPTVDPVRWVFIKVTDPAEYDWATSIKDEHGRTWRELLFIAALTLPAPGDRESPIEQPESIVVE